MHHILESNPPATTIVSPEMNDASLDARKETTLAQSSGCPYLKKQNCIYTVFIIKHLVLYKIFMSMLCLSDANPPPPPKKKKPNILRTNKRN